MFYYEILKALEENKIKYLIVGGLAVNLHNVPRMTNDFDLILDMNEENLLNFVNLMKTLGYVSRVPVDPLLLAEKSVRENWINEKNMKAFSFYKEDENYKVIDIVLEYPIDFNESFNHKCIRRIKDIPIYYVSIDDLIKMKKYSGRDQDLNDIEMLEKVKKIL